MMPGSSCVIKDTRGDGRVRLTIVDCTCRVNPCTGCQYGCDASIVPTIQRTSVYSIQCMCTQYRTKTIAVSESLNFNQLLFLREIGINVDKLQVTLEIISSQSLSPGLHRYHGTNRLHKDVLAWVCVCATLLGISNQSSVPSLQIVKYRRY